MGPGCSFPFRHTCFHDSNPLYNSGTVTQVPFVSPAFVCTQISNQDDSHNCNTFAATSFPQCSIPSQHSKLHQHQQDHISSIQCFNMRHYTMRETNELNTIVPNRSSTRNIRPETKRARVKRYSIINGEGRGVGREISSIERIILEQPS